MKANREQFFQAIRSASRLAGKRMTLPVLSCVRLEATGGKLSIRASDLECDLTSVIDCDGDLAPMCVPVRPLAELSGSGGESVELAATDNRRVSFKCSGEASIGTILPEEFPALPSEKIKAIGVNNEDLARAIKSVAWATSTDPGRYALNFVVVQTNEKEIFTCATDGKSLSSCKVPSICGKSEMLLPPKYAGIFCDALAVKDCQFGLMDSHAHAKHEHGEVLIRLADCAPPAVGRIVEGERNSIGSFSTAEILSEVRNCIACSSNIEKYYSVTLDFGKKGLTISIESPENKYAAEIAGKFSPVEFRLDANRLLASLRSFSCDDLKVSWADNALFLENGELLSAISSLGGIPKTK